MEVMKYSLGFGLLIGGKKQTEDLALASGKIMKSVFQNVVTKDHLTHHEKHWEQWLIAEEEKIRRSLIPLMYIWHL